MTNNTFYYAQILNTREQIRVQDEHNKRQDEETAKHNRAQEDFNLNNLAETKRHYEETERLQAEDIAERRRNNQAMEAENQRYHDMLNAIQEQSNAETLRHDAWTEFLQHEKNQNEAKYQSDSIGVQRSRNAVTEELGLINDATANKRIQYETDLGRSRNAITAEQNYAANALRERETEVLEGTAPYQRFNLVTQGIHNLTGGLKDIGQTVGVLFDNATKPAQHTFNALKHIL